MHENSSDHSLSWDRDLTRLRENVKGTVSTPGTNGYDDAVAVFNQVVTHRPAVVVTAASAGDIATAVCFARSHGLAIAVLNTGHSPSIPATDTTLLISTRRMTKLHVDSSDKTAHVEAGVNFQQLVATSTLNGLAPLVDSYPGVGVVGDALSGGASPIVGRAYGWACDYVTSMEVVTADAKVRKVSHLNEPALFGALLGGRSNFGVVTAMNMELFQARRLYAGIPFFSGENAPAVLRAYQALTTSAPNELSSGIAFVNFPHASRLPSFMQGKPTVCVRVSYQGPQHIGARLLAPLRDAGPLLMDSVSETIFADFDSISMDPTSPSTTIEHFGLLDEMTPNTVDAILEIISPESGNCVNLLGIRHLRGAFGRPPPTPNAVGGRSAAFALSTVTEVPPGDNVAAYASSGEEIFYRLAPWVNPSRHPSFLSPADATVERTRDAYEPEVYQHLRKVKTAYDPSNIFRINHNIPPYQSL